MDDIKIIDKTFEVFINEQKIQERIRLLADKINIENKGKEILFLSILNGSFVFTADLFRLINSPARISFLKLASYSGTRSTGSIRELIGLNENLSGKTVIIIEDIVDTGRTLANIIEDLDSQGAEEIKVATLLYKPAAYKGSNKIDYVGFEIPNNFVVGYGLDYDGLGRNLSSIYKLKET